MSETVWRTPTPAEIRELSQLRPWRFALAYAVDWGLIALLFAGAAWLNHPAGYVLCVFFIGACQHALGILGHEATHSRVHANRRLNNFLANLFNFWPLGLDGLMYQRFHLAHHLHTGAAGDPELKAKARQAPNYDLPMTVRHIGVAFLKDLVGGGIGELLNFFRMMPPASIVEILGPVLWWAAALAVLQVTGGLWIAAVWFAALFTSYWAVFRVRIFCEHMGTSGTHRTSQTWWQRLLFFPHNIGYHYEHHNWPSIPFWNLPKVRLLDTTVPVVPAWQMLRSYAAHTPLASGDVPMPLPADEPTKAA
jgi:fatty acid desaturase